MRYHDEWENLALPNRRQQAGKRQLLRRTREHSARCRAAEFSNDWGRSTSQAARRLNIHRRTLAHWRSHHQKGSLTNCLRGRPCKESSYAKRHNVLEMIQAVGPHVGLPSLRSLFADMPRCELVDLQRDYRRHYQQQNRVVIHQLTWTTPGQVWAMDHAEAPVQIEDACQAVFAVRDLASGMQLAWLPIIDQTAESMLPLLTTLFDTYGPPLVIKSDNGSAFRSDDVQDLLMKYRVVHLPSPPRTPSYNGSCEAGIGSMKQRTSYHAARMGRTTLWTPDDFEAARRQANEVHHATCTAPTAMKRWDERLPIVESQRQTLRNAIDRNRSEHIASLQSQNICTSTTDNDTMQRIAIRRALVELGMLTLNRRFITLPIKPNNLAKFS